MIKKLTNSNIERQNILNNKYAIQEIQNNLWIQWFSFEWKIWFTKKQVINFFEVDRKTIDRYLEENNNELRKNWYEIFTGKRLQEAKKTIGRDKNVPNEEKEDIAQKPINQLWLFDFRSFLNLWMLLKESKKAQELRNMILNITIDTIYKKTWGNTKYINTKDPEFLESYFKWESYRKKFTDALKDYVNMWNIKYPLYTDKVYEIAFKEKAKEYKKILWLSDNDKPRDTFYSEVLDVIAWLENWIASEIKSKYQQLWRNLYQNEIDQIFYNAENNSFLKPLIEKARTLMSSRDLHFRDVLHEKIKDYLWTVDEEDFERFIWEKSIEFEKKLKETKDVIKRLKNK